MNNFVRTSVFKVAYPMAKIKAKHPADTQFVDEKTGKSKAGKTYSYKELKALKEQGHPDGAHYDDYVARRTQANAMNDQFLAAHPADPNNLLNTLHRATPKEYNEGKNWYAGANYTAHVMARDVSHKTGKKVTADQMAGLIANYSPQMAWHGNMRWASEAAHAAASGDHAAIPGMGGAGWKSKHDGKGGMFTHAQAMAAKSIMEGNDWRSVLGKLKIGNFGGNIATGGKGDPKKDADDVGADEGTGHSRPKITIDRHALSGVLGEYSDEGVYNRANLGDPKTYDQYVDHFHNGTQAFNDMHGDDLSDADGQAVAWVVQQRENGEKGHTTPKNAEVAKKSFDNYAAQYHPDLVDNTPGVGFQGAGGMATNLVGGSITPKETFHGMPSWDEDVASGVDPHPNHPIAAGGAPVAQAPKVFASPLHPLNANNKTMEEMKAAQPQQAVAARHFNPANPGGPQWQPQGPEGETSIRTPQGIGGYYDNIEDNKDQFPIDGGAHLYEQPQNTQWGNYKDPETARAEIEKQLVDPSISNGRHHAMVRKASSSKFQYDAVSDQFKTSDLSAKFACNCGAKFAPKDFHRCNCGRSYASFDIVSADKTAAKTVRVVRPVKEHRDRILARVASLSNMNYAVADPIQAAKNADYIAYLQRRADMAGVIGGSDDDRVKTERDDDPDYQSADSTNQEPSHAQSVEINNEFSQGIKPTHDQSLPYFIRTDHSDDAAPVVFDKESKLTPIFVRTSYEWDASDEAATRNSFDPQDNQNLPRAKNMPQDDPWEAAQAVQHPNVRKSALPYIRTPVNKLNDMYSADGNEPPLAEKPKNYSPQFGTQENPAPVTTRQGPKKQTGPVNHNPEWNPQSKVGANPTVPRHLDPTNPGGPQWNQTGINTQQINAPFGQGAVNNNYGMGQVAGPGIGGGHKVIDPLADQGQALPPGGLQNEVENQLAFDTGRHHSESPGRHRAKKETMEFNEDDFRLGYSHAENDGRLPKTASRSFIEGYIEYLKPIVADRAPGWDTVAPAFEKPDDKKTNGMDDLTNTKPATDDGKYQQVRKDLADKLDSDTAAGQSRDDQGVGINRPTTDLEGWVRKNSKVILAHINTAELAREIAVRSNAV